MTGDPVAQPVPRKLVLGDVPPPLALLGGVLCLAGVAVTRGTGIPRRVGVDPRIRI